ncbi:MAG: hypothetical protein U5L03_09305 [Burkholderiaceae bacterium]|nr:hypothetical protein [Burkholderiaceae bacterium]
MTARVVIDSKQWAVPYGHCVATATVDADGCIEVTTEVHPPTAERGALAHLQAIKAAMEREARDILDAEAAQ